MLKNSEKCNFWKKCRKSTQKWGGGRTLIDYFEKIIFRQFLAVLRLIKSEDLSEQKMTKLLKGAIVLFSNLVILCSSLGKAASIRGVS